ncbi:hypothetical protein [Chlorogloeopsis sp. ULAP02]|uniref:hypothetical protein n=1 Tax=Chlorogloeopsis sp. ULAP02 TaxID=3107926 RepID=UPI003134B43E
MQNSPVAIAKSSFKGLLQIPSLDQAISPIMERQVCLFFMGIADLELRFLC